MFQEIEFNNNSPIYLQISKFFEALVILQKLKPGDLVPSRRELATIMKVNLNTIQKSYAHLEEIGLIVTEKNKYSSITTDEKILDEIREEYIKEPVIDFIKTMKSINISKKDIQILIDDFFELV